MKNKKLNKQEQMAELTKLAAMICPTGNPDDAVCDLLNSRDEELGLYIAAFFYDQGQMASDFRGYLGEVMEQKQIDICNQFISYYKENGEFIENLRLPVLTLMADHGARWFAKKLKELEFDIDEDLLNYEKHMQDCGLAGDILGMSLANLMSTAFKTAGQGYQPQNMAAMSTGILTGLVARVAMHKKDPKFQGAGLLTGCGSVVVNGLLSKSWDN